MACQIGSELQKVHDAAYRVAQDSLAGLQGRATFKMRKRAVDKAVLAQLAYDKLADHVTGCAACARGAS